jgi:histidinol-phosphatase (PHP family)
MIDFHVHTTISCDGHCTLQEVCSRATEIGLQSICLTEHMDFDPNDPGYGFLNYGEYSSRVDEARSNFHGKLNVFKGIEADYQSRFEDKIRRWLLDKEFDLVLGSVHYVDGAMLSEEMLREKPLDDIYRVYLEGVTLSARSGLFGAIGHLDYVKKYSGDATYLESNHRLAPLLKKTVQAIVASGTALEVSTKGLVSKSRDYRPSLGIVRRYRQLGGRKITIGSDAHDCRVLGTGVQKLQKICEKMGLEVLVPAPVNLRIPVGRKAE